MNYYKASSRAVRRCRFLRLVLCISLLQCAFGLQKLQAFQPTPITKTLSNGATAYIVPDPNLKLVAVDVWVRAGAAMEKPDESGAAHFVEHVIFKGTSTRGPGQMDIEIENVGAVLNATTSKDWARFYTTIAAEHLEKAVDLLSDAVTNPIFDISQVKLETRVVEVEIYNRRINPSQFIDDTLAKMLFADHPYGSSVYGEPANIAKLNSETLKAFHKRCYTSKAVSIVVVGNVDPVSTVQLLDKAFSKLPSGEPEPWPHPAKPLEDKQVQNLKKPADGSQWLGFGFIGPSLSTEPADVWAMDVLTAILARKGAGRLHERVAVQDKSGAGVDTSFLTMRLPAMVSIISAATEGSVQQVEDAVMDELQKIRSEAPSAQEIVAAKRSLLGTYAFEVETASGLAGSLGFYSVISSVADSVNYAGNINKVQPEDVRRIAAKYLNPDKCAVVRLVE